MFASNRTMLRVFVVFLAACGGSQPAKRNGAEPCRDVCNTTSLTAAIRNNECIECKRARAPWSMTCEERCSFESEWYVGCLTGCRGAELPEPLFARDAGVPPD